jgi:hypothetical protein
MGVSKVTAVADSAPSFCELLSLVLTGIAPHLSPVVNIFSDLMSSVGFLI